MISELIKHGAAVKEKNKLGWTPLDEAVSYGERSTSKMTLHVWGGGGGRTTK